MAVVPIDLSGFKPETGDDVDADPIANAYTAIESWSGSGIDPQAMLQKAAATGQVLAWDGAKWTPGDGRYPMAPTILGPTSGIGGLSALTANSAYLMPVPLFAPTVITRIGFGIGTGGSTGNMDVGVYYSDDEATYTRLVSKGSTATPAASLAQVMTVASTTLTPVSGRRWYLALACSSATPTFSNAQPVVGAVSKTSSFPLPSSLTSVSALTGTNLFLYGLV